jgi:hypothetical protein
MKMMHPIINNHKLAPYKKPYAPTNRILTIKAVPRVKRMVGYFRHLQTLGATLSWKERRMHGKGAVVSIYCSSAVAFGKVRNLL